MKEIIRCWATGIFRFIRSTTGYVPPERVFRHLHFTGPFNVTLPGGSSLMLHSWGNRVENELAWRGWDGHETPERRRWAAMVAPGGDVLDIGANTATYALTAKALSPASRVHAIEPLARIAAMARQNAATAGLDVHVACLAFARDSGELPIYDPGGANAYSASLSPDFLPGEKSAYLVPVDSVDAYCREQGLDPLSIKIDVEGLEGDVICGAAGLLERGRCIILCEWLGSSESHREAQALLQERGYIALDVEDLAEVTLDMQRGFTQRNLILVHRSRAAEFRARTLPA